MENIEFSLSESSSNSFVGDNQSLPNTPPPPPPQMDFNTTTVDNNLFIEQVKAYIKINNPQLCILTPCYGGMCNVNYLESLLQTISVCSQLTIPVCIEFCKNDSLISRARNNLIAKAMNNPKITHIIFIDSDISWNPLEVLKLLISDKPLIGGAYPLKKYNWSSLVNEHANTSNIVQSILNKKKNLKMMSDEDVLQCNMVSYNLNYLENVIQIEDNVAKVKHVATGFMMIQRNTLTTMMNSYPETKYTDDIGVLTAEENNYAYSLFDCAVIDQHYYSEDWLFCHRWSKLGNDVWVDVSVNLNHSGMVEFRGSLLASFTLN